MCQLFAFSSNKEILLNEGLKEFYQHSEYHPHGWGLELFGDEPVLLKEPKKATESEFLKVVLSQPLKARSGLAHIRYATVGELNSFNCHPFLKKDASGKEWSFMHNGTIFKGEDINQYQNKQLGSTDSERIFLFLLDHISRSDLNKDDQIELIRLVDNLVKGLSEGNKLNLILTDGDLFIIHYNTPGQLYFSDEDGQIIICSEKLKSIGKNWKPFPINRTVAIEDGKIIYQGKAHKNTFTMTEQEQFSYFETHENFLIPDRRNHG